jgi:hypothetical protein
VQPQALILEDGSSILLIHFTYLIGRKWIIACMPEAEVFHAFPGRNSPVIRSNDRSVVNCPFCKQTDDYIKNREQTLATKAFDFKELKMELVRAQG